MQTARTTTPLFVSQTLLHLRAISDFVALLGLLWGVALGLAVAHFGHNDIGLTTQIVGAALLQKLPSLTVAMVLAVRLVLFQSLERDGNAGLGADMLAAVWTSCVAVVVFVALALLGLAVGIESDAAGMAHIWLDQIGQSYSVWELPRLFARMCLIALGLGWIGHVDRLLLRTRHENPSRSATRLLWLMIIAILVVEVFDSYLNGMPT